ncbi:cytochrome c oxidase accessory protein CcoG [Comamonadaceae bacterium M7527]|nr:cytochrome c oxidase accessory protein CcoG [Comamonadaceae bacterium M7527]
MNNNKKVTSNATASDEAVTVSLYQSQAKIYARAVTGIFTSWRWVFVWATQLVFYGLPWLSMNDRQAVLFDLEARRFYIFNLVLYPQDFIYLTGLLIISALALFLFTAVAGRLWCGYACPQTVYTEIFMWIEHKIEGDRSARMRLDKNGWTGNRAVRKMAKHGLWLLVALWTGATFVGYFTPVRELVGAMAGNALGPWQTFWVFFYGFATYGNAGFMREQVCKYMCPYARFQSAMFDKDTMIVTYDEARGEPRGARKKSASPSELNLGSCIDCTMCVQVCPTGIDIRNGLQYECIGCGACIDVCDEVMDKMGYERGLVKYATQNGMAGGWSRAQMLRRALRPRVLVYTSILVLITVSLFTSLFLRDPMRVDIIRDRGALARMVEKGWVENVYRLQLMNATEHTQRYAVSISGLDGGVMTADDDGVFEVLPAEIRSVAVRVRVPPMRYPTGSYPLQFVVQTLNAPAVKRHTVTETSTFVMPR